MTAKPVLLVLLVSLTFAAISPGLPCSSPDCSSALTSSLTRSGVGARAGSYIGAVNDGDTNINTADQSSITTSGKVGSSVSNKGIINKNTRAKGAYGVVVGAGRRVYGAGKGVKYTTATTTTKTATLLPVVPTRLAAPVRIAPVATVPIQSIPVDAYLDD